MFFAQCIFGRTRSCRRESSGRPHQCGVRCQRSFGQPQDLLYRAVELWVSIRTDNGGCAGTLVCWKSPCPGCYQRHESQSALSKVLLDGKCIRHPGDESFLWPYHVERLWLGSAYSPTRPIAQALPGILQCEREPDSQRRRELRSEAHTSE